MIICSFLNQTFPLTPYIIRSISLHTIMCFPAYFITQLFTYHEPTKPLCQVFHSIFHQNPIDFI